MALIRVISVFCIWAALLLCVSWQETRTRLQERRLQELKAMLETRTAEMQTLQAHVARLQSPQRIKRMVEALDMGLVPPAAAPPLIHRRLASFGSPERVTELPGLQGAERINAAE